MSITKQDILIYSAAAILTLVGLSRLFIKPVQAACQSTRTVAMLIAGDAFSPSVLTVNRCDTVTINNTGNQTYQIAFGVHDNHINYPGFTPDILTTGQSVSFVALQPGSFELHDHFADKAKAIINIRQ